MRTARVLRRAAAAVLSIVVIGGGGIWIGRQSTRESATRQVSGPGAAGTAPAAKELYRCPMHPSVVSDKPGQCPICHMDLQKVEEEPSPPADDARGAGEGAEPMEGRTAFGLSLERQQLIGVTTAPVESRHLHQTVQATGRVAYDPELFAAIEEYRQALVTRRETSGSAYPSLRNQARELVKSSRTKLRLMGLSERQIDALAKQGSDSMSLLLPGNSVWIYAEVFEFEVGGLRPGLEVRVEAPSLRGEVFEGKIASISPVVSGETRTVRVRAQVPDPRGLLRPDMFVNVTIQLDHGVRLAVPEDAVLHSGGKRFVFVARGEGRFEPREVKLGLETGDWCEVVSGLQAGERVVTSANFFIDSESRLRAALRGAPPAAPEAERGGEPSGDPHAGH